MLHVLVDPTPAHRQTLAQAEAATRAALDALDRDKKVDEAQGQRLGHYGFDAAERERAELYRLEVLAKFRRVMRLVRDDVLLRTPDQYSDIPDQVDEDTDNFIADAWLLETYRLSKAAGLIADEGPAPAQARVGQRLVCAHVVWA